MESKTVIVLPPEPPLRWRPEYVNFLRRQYEGLDRWSAETGAPIASLIRKAVDEALRGRGFEGACAIVESQP
jgi:hypothetical protein